MGSHDDGNRQQASAGTPDRQAVGENPRLGLFAQQIPAHPLHQSTHANRHPAAAVHSVGRDPSQADLQIPRPHHGHSATMETPRGRSAAQGNQDHLGPQQPGQLDVGPDPGGYADDLPRGSGAVDHVRMLGVVQLQLANKEQAVHGQDTDTTAKHPGAGGPSCIRRLPGHLGPCSGHRNIPPASRAPDLEASVHS